MIDYSFIDHNPIIGNNYYRLLQMDYDGKYEYYGPINQSFEQNGLKAKLKLYPNPIETGYLNISIGKQMVGGDIIEVYDYLGRLQYAYQVTDDRNSLQLNISELKKGMYILRYQCKAEQLTSRLIVQ